MKSKISSLILLFCLSLFLSPTAQAQNSKSKKEKEKPTLLSGFKLRNIGPAFMSGRVADMVIHPQDESIWYVAIGSGGVWKTENAGVTWKPIFDKQSVYSIGCITIDPNNPHKLWVGTGENVGGRHVSYGDGVYVSEDDGETWSNMGLKKSQHISKIIVHPSNPNVIWVAVQGSLWNKGGQRGLYKSKDGGKTWIKKLGDNQWMGVTDVIIDPRNPDRLYAATWERHRTVAAYMGGGKKSGIYSSSNGGDHWVKLTKGLPTSKIGKIGLAISPQKPDIIYAAIELNLRKGGIYKSTDRGASWKKQSDMVSSGTGPHYYQELYASPHQFDRIYLADVRMKISEDGGKTFRTMKEEHKHSDNHALSFKKSDPDYLLVGSDGGVYESFDLGTNWRMMPNLPTLQYYKLALDDAKPFYNIYGGTQDNNSHIGPSRTDNIHGIRNADWSVPLYGDGHQPATEPGNPNIAYFESQQGNLVRFDKKTGEITSIKPQPRAGESYERFNWDAPILVSPHKPSRIYFASQRVWKSENRGDSWEAISGDLTKNQQRLDLPIMGSKQRWNSPWDNYAMSNYNTITSLAASPVKEVLIYAGTDDGQIQVTDNGGKSWKKIDLKRVNAVPKTAFVNDIKADLFDENTVYAALDNHKYGDFKPYLIKSTDRGKTWKNIASNIPKNTLVWRMEQDHIQANLLFAATEFGLYTSLNGGKKWHILNGGVPTISFRDLKIHRGENDLVGASFGRGFFVLDDYSPLRDISDAQMKKDEATLFNARFAWWYVPRRVIGYKKKANKGADHYTAPNPEFGATFTYYLRDKYASIKELREAREKKSGEKNISFPGWDTISKELETPFPKVYLTIQDMQGAVVRRILCPNKKGFNRVSWDLRYPSFAPIQWDKKNLQIVTKKGKDHTKPSGFLAMPGTYTASLSKKIDGVFTSLSKPITFKVRKMSQGSLEGSDTKVLGAFLREIEGVQQHLGRLHLTLKQLLAKTNALNISYLRSKKSSEPLEKRMKDLRTRVLSIYHKIYGNTAKNEMKEKTNPTISDRIYIAIAGNNYSTYGSTPMHRESLAIAKKELKVFDRSIKATQQEIFELETDLKKVEAPWVEGQKI